MRIFILFLFAMVQSQHVNAAVADLIQQHKSELESFYKDLHENPELSGEEKRTSEKIVAEFKALGLEVIDKIGGYGVVGIMRNGKGPTTLIRAEMDGLPVTEETKLPYASKTPGKMHACAHDFHAMAVLGAAKVMNGIKSEWKGTLVFLAQPAEETVKGARAMIKDGLFKKIPKPDQTLSLHTTGLYKRGTLGITSGYAFANSDSVEVIFKGRGTHGSKPEMGTDPFIQAAEYVLKLQTLVGREKSALKPAVISVGSIHGGTKGNIIPEDVKLQITLRTYENELREHFKKRIIETAFAIAKASNAPEPSVEFPEGTDATYNTPVLAEKMKNLFIEKLGKDAFVETEPTMGGEDFGYFAREVNVPSLMFWVGQRDEKNPKTINHSPRYYPDLATGPLAIKGLAFGLLDLHKK